SVPPSIGCLVSQYRDVRAFGRPVKDVPLARKGEATGRQGFEPHTGPTRGARERDPYWARRDRTLHDPRRSRLTRLREGCETDGHEGRQMDDRADSSGLDTGNGRLVTATPP